MNESTSNHLNECDFDDSSETHQLDENRCVVDEKFVPKVGMIFKTLEEARKFYKHYSKLVDFSTKIRNTTRDGDKIKNQLIRGEVKIQDIFNFEDKPFSWVKLSGSSIQSSSTLYNTPYMNYPREDCTKFRVQGLGFKYYTIILCSVHHEYYVRFTMSTVFGLFCTIQNYSSSPSTASSLEIRRKRQKNTAATTKERR
ncbi:hypothetical protein Ahy_B03g067535 [Arachis hypogaea]|uniref:FAR1 domain-containing protein n=1 Tax=Arachis hypogaea TaxID=3818 RepID=A0A445A721_ARAHY|nr:hypothetical protein Ahy_B03g067535 [Arachis hypogaea]